MADSIKEKPFKAYKPRYIHIDYKYLPQTPNESRRRYLIVAIARATRWIHAEIKTTKSA